MSPRFIFFPFLPHPLSSLYFLIDPFPSLSIPASYNVQRVPSGQSFHPKCLQVKWLHTFSVHVVPPNATPDLGKVIAIPKQVSYTWPPVCYRIESNCVWNTYVGCFSLHTCAVGAHYFSLHICFFRFSHVSYCYIYTLCSQLSFPLTGLGFCLHCPLYKKIK